MEDAGCKQSLMSTGEVARYLGVSQSIVLNYIVKGILVPDATPPMSRNGKSGRRKFKKSTVDAVAVKIGMERGNA